MIPDSVREDILAMVDRAANRAGIASNNAAESIGRAMRDPSDMAGRRAADCLGEAMSAASAWSYALSIEACVRVAYLRPEMKDGADACRLLIEHALSCIKSPP